MEDWRGLGMESGDVAYLAPPFPADPHALGTTLLEGGEDDMGMTEEVQSNLFMSLLFLISVRFGPVQPN